MVSSFLTDNTRSNKFEFPIDGYILFSGYGHLIAAFGRYEEAAKVQELMARDKPGEHFTILSCDGYSTRVCDFPPEPTSDEVHHDNQ